MRWLIFSLVVAAIGLKDVLLFGFFRSAIRSRLAGPARSAAVAALAGLFVVMNIPIVLLILGQGRNALPSGDGWAAFYSYGVNVWHLLGVVLAVGWGLFALGRMLLTLPRRMLGPAAPAMPTPADEPAEPATLTRRRLLADAAVATPALLWLGGTSAAVAERGRFAVTRLDLTLPGLPPALRGMTIAQISDLHIGWLAEQKLLDPMVEAVADLRADLVVMTGDLVHNDLTPLPECLAALRQLPARVGVFACMGNHDYIQDGEEFIRRVRAADIHGQGDDFLLINRSLRLRHNGAEFVLGGADWVREDAGHAEAIARTFADAPEGATKILLAHHPHAFDAAADAGVALTLSGHTHGGQFVFHRADGPAPVRGGAECLTGPTASPGSLMYRYVSGLYRKGGGSLLYVNRGLGNWFPLRINCPAELTLITLS
jgi:predicted MPP superfamily phosphohydrolase